MHKKEIERLSALMRSITAKAKAENRELTAEEQAKLSVYQSEIAEHEKALDEEKRQEEARQEAERMLAARTRTLEAFKSFGFEAEGLTFVETAEREKRSYTDADVNSAVLELLKKNGSASHSKVSYSDNQPEDKYRAAAVDALLIKAGFAPEKPAEGARGLANMRLRDLASDCFERGGEFTAGQLRQMSGDDVFIETVKRAYTPTSAFGAIMDSAVKKTLVEAYKAVPTTFQLFTTKGVLTDFKEDTDKRYAYGSGDRFERVPENGELKQSKIETKELPHRKLETYGKQVSMTRQAFINDDIGLVLQIPHTYAAMAKQTINEQVYDILFNNGKIFDGKVLFDATNHKNLIAAGSAPSQDSVQKMILQMGKQTDHFGKYIVNKPKFIITGVGYQFTLATLFGSRNVPGSSNNDLNPLFENALGKNLIEDPYLNTLAEKTTDKACPWFMISDPTFVKSIQVDYLNGNETPTIRRNDGIPGTLGMSWDIYHDWGVFVADFRGVCRNNGVKIEG